ncbi:hypothetical protein ACFLRF_04440 [Candidatus Altiarchaeota archaeon]
MMDELTPRKLASILVEKHDRFITEYSEEVEKWEVYSMLKEKRDQIMHWIEDDEEGKFAKELDSTQKELDDLGNVVKSSSKAHYNTIKLSVKEHSKSREYWLQKLKELSE